MSRYSRRYSSEERYPEKTDNYYLDEFGDKIYIDNFEARKYEGKERYKGRYSSRDNSIDRYDSSNQGYKGRYPSRDNSIGRYYPSKQRDKGRYSSRDNSIERYDSSNQKYRERYSARDKSKGKYDSSNQRYREKYSEREKSRRRYSEKDNSEERYSRRDKSRESYLERDNGRKRYSRRDKHTYELPQNQHARNRYNSQDNRFHMSYRDKKNSSNTEEKTKKQRKHPLGYAFDSWAYQDILNYIERCFRCASWTHSGPFCTKYPPLDPPLLARCDFCTLFHRSRDCYKKKRRFRKRKKLKPNYNLQYEDPCPGSQLTKNQS